MGYEQINIRTTDSLKDDIEEWADRAGLSVSDYLREAARQKAQREDLAE